MMDGFERAVDASASVKLARRLVRGSIVCRSLVAVMRAASPDSSYVWARVRPVAPPGQFPNTLRILADSRMSTLVDQAGRQMLRAWDDSTIRQTTLGWWSSAESAQRVRLVGWAVLVSTGVRILFRRPTVPVDAFEVAGWVLPFLFGGLLLCGAEPMALHWRTRYQHLIRRSDER